MYKEKKYGKYYTYLDLNKFKNDIILIKKTIKNDFNTLLKLTSEKMN